MAETMQKVTSLATLVVPVRTDLQLALRVFVFASVCPFFAAGHGHRTASDLVVGTWVLVEVRERTHDMGELWLGRCLTVAEWSGSCRKQVVLPAGRKLTKKYGVRWDAGDWMVAVQWFSVNDDGEYFQDAPCIDIFNSSELRLAGFAATQSRGPRQVNTRSRREDQAAHQAEL